MQKNKRNIVFFLPSFEGGGAERNVINLLKNINENEFGLSLLLAEKKGDFLKDVPDSICISSLETKSKAYFMIFFKMMKYLQQEKPDILISSFPHFNIISLVARMTSGAKTKIIITEHVGLLSLPEISSSFFNGLVSRFILPFFVKFFYPKADAIVCVSKGVADDLYKIIKKDLSFEIIHNPIDIKYIKKLAGEKVEHKWFSDSKIPIVIMAGRLIKQKDYPTAFLALSLVNKKRNVKMAVLGRGSEEEKLKKYVKDLGLSEKIIFLGFQENPYKYIKKASVFVLSSIKEGFGNVLAESMACGIPVISTDCPFGPNEIIENGKNGILVPVKNSKKMAKAILDILENSALKSSLVNEGKKKAVYFSVENIGYKYKKILNKVK